MLVFADNPNIETAPLPVMVATAALGFLMVRSRSAVLEQVVRATFLGVRTIFGRSVVTVAGYGLLVVGVVGTVLWFVDNL